MRTADAQLMREGHPSRKGLGDRRLARAVVNAGESADTDTTQRVRDS